MRIIPAMLHSIDSEGRLTFVSDMWLMKLGYRREEVIGRKSSEFLTAESREHAVLDVLPVFFKTGHCENVEYQMVCKDGRIIDVLLSGVLLDGPPKVGRISVAVITDVTAEKSVERQVAVSEALYRELVEEQSDLISLASLDGELRFVNAAYASLHRLDPRDMIGKNLFDFIPAEDRAAVDGHIQHALAGTEAIDIENQMIFPDGRSCWISWSNKGVHDADGRVVAIHSVGRNIDRRVKIEQKLKESEAQYRLLAEHSSDMVFQLDRALVRQYASPSCREVLGYEPADLVGTQPVSMIHPEDADRVKDTLYSLIDGRSERRSFTNRIRHKDGHWIWVEAQVRAIIDAETGAATGIIGALRDITARKLVEDQLAEANRRLEILASKDSLTELLNRRAFDEKFAVELKRAKRKREQISLLMIDVDQFKAFNDLYGHPAGDACLKGVADALRSTIRRPSDFAARYGGEEFVVLLPDTDKRGALQVAENIRMAICDLAILHAKSPSGQVSVSIGAASLARDTIAYSTMENLIKAADSALYVSKKAGRDTVRHTDDFPTP